MGKKHFAQIMISYTNKVAVFKNLFALICSQPKDKQNCTHNFSQICFEWSALNYFHEKYAFKTRQIIATKNKWLIATKNVDRASFKILLEMCVQNLKLIVCSIFVLQLHKRSPPRHLFPNEIPLTMKTSTSNSL